MSVDVSSLLESVTQDKNGKMIIVSVSAKNPKAIAYAKKIMLGILVHVLVISVIKIGRLVNT